MNETTERFTAFAGPRLLASGELAVVAAEVREALRGAGEAAVLVFDNETGRVVDLDPRAGAAAATGAGGDADVPAAGDGAPRRGPGRPKLGVVAGEVTLLPRHWEWLKSQPGGASVAIRKLVDEARRATEAADAARRARDATYRFMSAIAGDQPWYEEALRALYSNRRADFEERTRFWPADVRDHALRLAAPAFADGDPAPEAGR
ncbi:MAG TPA: DUF2239 family protein [Longimicrobium sp.]|nr:DUF2239 family protein [Longimicrobium sp.]